MKKILMFLVVLTILLFSTQSFAGTSLIFFCEAVNESPQSFFILWKHKTNFEVDIYENSSHKPTSVKLPLEQIVTKFEEEDELEKSLKQAKIDMGRSGSISISRIDSNLSMISNHQKLNFPEGTEVVCITKNQD